MNFRRNSSKSYGSIEFIAYHCRCAYIAGMNSNNISFMKQLFIVLLCKLRRNIFIIFDDNSIWLNIGIM